VPDTERLEALIKAARMNRHGLRDGLMISLACHHGFRVPEHIDLRWSAIDWKQVDIAVTRPKNGKDTRQPLDGADLRALRALYRDRQSDEYVFMSERGPFTRDGFAKLLEAAAKRAGIENAHPLALRRALWACARHERSRHAADFRFAWTPKHSACVA
jgi:integrase